MQPTYSFSSLLGFTLLLTFGAAAQTQTIKICPALVLDLKTGRKKRTL